MIYCWWCLNIWLSGSDIIKFIKEAQFMGPLRFPVESIQPLPWFNSKQHLFLFFRRRITTWRRQSFALKFQIIAVALWLRHPMVTSQHYNLPKIIGEPWNHLSHTSILSWIIWWVFFFYGLLFKMTTSANLWIVKAFNECSFFLVPENRRHSNLFSIRKWYPNMLYTFKSLSFHWNEGHWIPMSLFPIFWPTSIFLWH